MNEIKRDNLKSFITRMWLDYCDEHNDHISAPNRLTHEEYAHQYGDWLLEKYDEKYGING